MLLRLLLLLPSVLWGGALAKDSSYRLKLKGSVTVQESLCVSVPCKFSESWSFVGSPYLYWFKKEWNKNHGLLVATNNPKEELQETIQGRFLLLRDPKSNDCSLTIRDVNKRDNGTYYLYIENSFYYHAYEDQMLSLKVTALTDKPDIQIPGPLESGRPKNLNCYVPWACEEGTPPIFSWTSAAHTFLGPRSHHLSSVLTLTPRPQDHGTNLTCQVHFPAAGVSVESTIRLNVAYAPQNMAIRVFQGNSTALKILKTTSLSILEGEALRLLCEVDSNPPAKLSWFRGSPGLHATPLSSTAILELPRVGPAQEGEVTCQARHPLGSHRVSLSLSVVYPPQLLGPSCSWRDQDLFCSCSSRAQPAPSLRWRLGAGLLEGNHGNASHVVTSSSEGPWTNSSLSLRAGLSEGLRLSCEARNVHGAQSASVLLLPDPPQLLGPSCSWRDQDLFCSCSSRAQPAPSLRWRLGAGLLEGNHSNASHAVTSRSEGPWTNSSLSLRAGLSPDLRLSCEARNVLGAQSASVLRLPDNPPTPPPQLLGPSCSWEDQGLRCSCSSPAQPPPSLRWRLGNHGPETPACALGRNRTWDPSVRRLTLYPLSQARQGWVSALRPRTSRLQNGKPESRVRGVLGVVGGAGIMALALLSLCLCLICRVKTCREKAAQLLQSMDKDVHPGTGSGAHQHPFWADSSAAPPAAPPAPDGAGPPAKEEPELHYAFVRFHNRKPQGNEDANTVYSEIKTHK